MTITRRVAGPRGGEGQGRAAAFGVPDKASPRRKGPSSGAVLVRHQERTDKRGGRGSEIVSSWLKTMAACSAIAAGATSETDLINHICQAIVETGRCRRAWAFWNGGDETVEPVQGDFDADPTDGTTSPAASQDSAFILLDYRGQMCGLIRVSAADHNTFGDEELAFLKAIAEVTTIAAVSLRSEARYQREKTAKRMLYTRFVRTEEAERQRTVRELHDVLGQSFTVLKLLVHRAERAPEEVPDLLKEAGTIVDEMVTWSRDFMVDHQPQAFRESPLVPTMAAYFDRYTARTRVSVKFEYGDVPERLPYETSSAVFRIVQEALTNVVRHSGASEVEVALRAGSGTLCLQIRDRGKGFDPASRTGSLGLTGMRERANLLGGDFRVDSRPGGGTHIVVTLPGG